MRSLLQQRSAEEHRSARKLGSARGGSGSAPGSRARGAAAALPNARPWPLAFKTFISPSPSAQPEAPAWFDTRNCECAVPAVGDAAAWVAKGRVQKFASLLRDATCTCNDGVCPPDVNPSFITEAVGQDVCSLRRMTGYSCTLGCFGADKPVSWYGHSCGKDGEPACPLLVVTPSPTSTPSPTTPAAIVAPVVTWDASDRADLRGLSCEMLDGKEVCFSEDTQGRVVCPDFVTSRYLRDPPASGPYAVEGDITVKCGPEYAKSYYCTAHCQPGNSRVQWWTHDIAWCYSKDGAWACPSMHATVPKASFTVKPWSEPVGPVTPCQIAAAAGTKVGVIANLTVGLLTHEPRAFALSMATYEERGFFSLVPEFIIYMNGRSPALEDVVAPYIKKHPGVFKLMGTSTNVGIARGMVELTNAASNPYFLFLERDFWLVEPDTCAYEQLTAGMALLDTGSVHVVRYRHRKKAGRPNWAENFFKGHEDDAFVGRQPNLACNIYYWVPDVETRYPDHFKECGKDPQMLCSDSYYCNWTNNPQLWLVSWWNKEYVERFDKFKRNDPWCVRVGWRGMHTLAHHPRPRYSTSTLPIPSHPASPLSSSPTCSNFLFSLASGTTSNLI